MYPQFLLRVATLVMVMSCATMAHAQNKPPTVTLTAATTNQFVDVGNCCFQLTLEATDEDGQIQWVELIHNAVSLGNMGNGQRSTFYAEVHAGFNEYYAIAYDNQNGRATSGPVRITGNLPPSIELIEPTGPRMVYSLSEAVVVRAAASDPDGTIREVRLLENSTVIATDLQAPYEFLYKPMSYGSYILQVQAEDNRGRIQTSGYQTIQYVRVFDNLDSTVPINSATNVILRASNVGATQQKGEAKHAGVPGGKSVWFAWRALGSGTVTMDTIGSDFDTVLGVYTNATRLPVHFTNLVEVASNDNDTAIQPLSRVKFYATGGTTYYIAVDGRDGMAGNIQLRIGLAASRAPAHNFIANAVVATSPHNSNNIGADKEPGEPDHAGNPGGASMWYRINVTTLSQTWRITTEGSRFDTVLAIYTNVVAQPQFAQLPPAMEDLRLVAFNDDGPVTNTSEIILIPKTIGTYWIAVDGYNGAEGMIRFTASTLSIEPAPVNDFFGKAITLVGSSALVRVNTTRASREAGEPAPLNESGQFLPRTVWYRWVAPDTGLVYMTTEWSDFDTVLAVYTGTNIANLTLVASNDDVPGGGQTSALMFNAIEGREYRIGIGGYRGAAGNVVFALNQNAFFLPRLITQFQSGRLLLSVSDANGHLMLESSTDLVNWTVVRLLEPGEELDIAVSQEMARAFYRVRTIE